MTLRREVIWISMLLVAVAFRAGAAWRLVGQTSLTPEQTLTAFFEAWATGDRKTAEVLLLRPDRLWHDFGRDVKSLHLVEIDRPFRAEQREVEYRQRHSDLSLFSRPLEQPLTCMSTVTAP